MEEAPVNEPAKYVEPERVACGVCLKEIPYSEAQHDEGGDCVLHFCGLECYKMWREQNKEGQ
ncbi:MAG TPA: DUF3330 domain-containing protein [Gammaproteobacteria bacterium]|nr:DUF3330 domain-containing protein [Gammaproteobacteria bacterium]